MGNLIPALIAALFGSFLGSFTTLLVWRLHHEESGIVLGRSRCPHCRKTLGASQLVPVFSWLFQRGRCAFCSEKIPVSYPLTELGFATVFFLFVQKFYSTDQVWLTLIACAFSLVLFFYDAQFSEVDRRISFPAILFALGWAFFRETFFTEFLIGGAIGFLFYFVQYFYSRKFENPWVGAGDAELGVFMGLVLGWKFLLLGLFFSYVLGTVVAGILLLLGRKLGWKSKLPMGAFLMPGLLLFLYAGHEIWQWYLHSFFLG